MKLTKFAKKPTPQQVEQEFYNHLRENVISGDALHELREEYPFTRPVLPARRWRELEANVDVSRGSALNVLGNIAIATSTLLEEAGRQPEPEHKMLQKIGSHAIALELLNAELEEDADKKNIEVPNTSAGDMSQTIEDSYSDWDMAQPDSLVTIVPGAADSVVTARVAQGALALLRDKLTSLA
ncbi:MAG TPA: hypothetical protein VJR27_01760 [Candidatus Saccharimonadales bacterium]|nr:hypothetical protein [Candidatus Saccharimonadales bacterium]